MSATETRDSDGYSWSGSLDETDIRALYAACHSLRFSGWLELKDAVHEAKVVFVGGEPVEISGGDTQTISLWDRGTFRAVQSIPDLSGELTTQREVRGSLGATKPSALWAWVSQYRLSCEIELERPGSKAVVSFQNGHAESAQVNGLPELAALARVSSWTDGTFRVRLRPLFVEGVIPMVPAMPDSAPPSELLSGAKQFDVSRSMPLGLKTPQPWGKDEAEPPKNGLPVGRVESTAQTRTPPRLEANFNLKPKRAKWPWLVAVACLAAAGGLSYLYYNHLPPFSPPPRPIVEPPLVPSLPKAIAPLPKTLEPSPAAETKTAETKTETKNAETKNAETKNAETKTPETKTPETKTPEPSAADKLVQKGRAALINGHAHTAVDLFRRAEKLRPKDATLRVYEQQAAGKLGHAELIVDGKGSLTIDGKKFAAPHKIKLPAGPHTIDTGDGESEVTLKRGEKKKLHVKK